MTYSPPPIVVDDNTTLRTRLIEALAHAAGIQPRQIPDTSGIARDRWTILADAVIVNLRALSERGGSTDALPSHEARTLHVANLADDDYEEGGGDRQATTDLSLANVVSSIDRDSVPGKRWTRHYPVLDLDIPAHLVPSTTPGHSHLYLDVPVSEDAFWKMCEALAEAGVLHSGYVSACRSRGYTSVRLPWVKKVGPEVEVAS